jgi:hypothetical protein
MDPNKQTAPVTLQTHDIDLVAIFAELLLQDLQTEVDKYGSYGKWLLAKRKEI